VEWLVEHASRIGFIVVLALFLAWLARRSIPRAVRLSVAKQRADVEIAETVALEEQEKRVDTLAHVLVLSVQVVIGILALFVILGEAGFELAPLLAGAGIAGIAIGFGAQSLVRDFLAGIFILLENQYGKGDVVRVADIAGKVEGLNLRRTVLRDLDGIVHTIPNGEIRTASNLTRSWSRVNLDVTVGYGEDLDRVTSVLDAVGEELAADPEWAPLIIEPPKVLRVNAFQDSGIEIKVLGTVAPMEQWNVAGQLRRRIKAAFDREGIEIPFPHRVVMIRREDGAE
jgi:small-conductance mechanosensitive channel